MEYINKFNKQWIERTRQSIASWSKQSALLEKKAAAGTLEPTESYSRRQIKIISSKLKESCVNTLK